ncbi:MAG: hypothetical protein LIO68_07710 [Rikenellaceae bacterium]|nr:hypothetical protein [Rikenellaceae bacterium]
MRYIRIFVIAATLISTPGISSARPARRPAPSEAELQNIRYGQPRRIETTVYTAHPEGGQWRADTGIFAIRTVTITQWNREGCPVTDSTYMTGNGLVRNISCTRHVYLPENGRKDYILTTTYDNDSPGKPLSTFRLEFDYDRQGRLKCSRLLQGDSLYYTNRYRLDRRGCIRLDKTFDSRNRPLSARKQRCDAHGNIRWMKNSVNAMGNRKRLTSIYRNSYENNLLRQTMLVRTRGGSVPQRNERAHYSYEYDVHGTWLKRIAWEENTPDQAQIHERRIEYYE